MALAAQSLSPPPELLLRAFAEATRHRFGLAQPARHPQSLARRLAEALALADFAPQQADAFVRALEVEPETAPVVLAAADAVPNHSTSFFRDAPQLEALVEAVARRVAPGAVVRLLSAGCSSGEEVYSLAMLAFERLLRQQGCRVELWGVDVSPRALWQAELARYDADALARVRSRGPSGWQEQWLQPDTGSDCERELRGALRQLCRFKRVNLARPEALSSLGRFDAILCRNVLLYFEPAHARAVAARMCGHLAPGGLLMLGASEPLPEPPPVGTRHCLADGWPALLATEEGA
ncbi:MAG: methyltransferase domain-containing protein [Myxococcaceae bacterium]|nr:methyltransferase domain-containing protein [Myxococcaceae bacterium]MCI0672631.1 methyltransferase domain-containing protein [Myxococcaceae bacterium]